MTDLLLETAQIHQLEAEACRCTKALYTRCPRALVYNRASCACILNRSDRQFYTGTGFPPPAQNALIILTACAGSVRSNFATSRLRRLRYGGAERGPRHGGARPPSISCMSMACINTAGVTQRNGQSVLRLSASYSTSSEHVCRGVNLPRLVCRISLESFFFPSEVCFFYFGLSETHRPHSGEYFATRELWLVARFEGCASTSGTSSTRLFKAIQG